MRWVSREEMKTAAGMGRERRWRYLYSEREREKHGDIMPPLFGKSSTPFAMLSAQMPPSL